MKFIGTLVKIDAMPRKRGKAIANEIKPQPRDFEAVFTRRRHRVNQPRVAIT